jgi:hypothetical protein
VTRLGEFSLAGWSFNSGSFVKITEVAQIIGLVLVMVKTTY